MKHATTGRTPERWIENILVRVVIGLTITCLLVFYLWQRNELLRYGYEIERMKRDVKSLQKTEEQLRAEMAALEKLKTVERRARKELGLVRPPADRLVFIEPSGPALENAGNRPHGR